MNLSAGTAITSWDLPKGASPATNRAKDILLPWRRSSRKRNNYFPNSREHAVHAETKEPLKILITAGSTVEPIDPVRYISNRSTGAAGYSLARAAVKRGWRVCLITGPAGMDAPEGAELVRIETAEQMKDEVLARAGEADCLIMAAAVCDFRPERAAREKIKKTQGRLKLELVKTPDILSCVDERPGFIKVGFALETEKTAENARGKLTAKGLDMVIANTAGGGKDPFGEGRGRKFDYIIIGKDLEGAELKAVTKEKMAEEVLDRVQGLI
ncbi:MAG: hypothetical protein GF409_06980 [Candidatus Omnitrophica bacterium]|nr:hypothetical protein [Candidatus Omnitrophota bacterium]